MKRRRFLETLVAGAALSACSAVSSSAIYQENHHLASSGNLQKVLLIGIDGVRPDALYAARTPNLDSLIAHGCYSDTAQAGKHTYSAPGWSNILCGVWEEKHGVTDNTFWGEQYGRYPSIFTRIEQLRPELNTASIVSWKSIHDNIIPAADYRRSCNDMTGDWEVTKDAMRLLSHEDPDVLFLYFGDADLVGHNYGFHPSVARYRKEIEEIDKQIGYVLQSLNDRPKYSAENWLIICTTDHGGTILGHGENIPTHRTIFYIASGPSAQSGRIRETPYQVDIVPTILEHLDVPIDPKWGLDGKVCGLK